MWPVVELIAHGHGIGDSMLLSAVARIAKQRGHSVEVRVVHLELYEASEDVVVARPWDSRLAVPFWGIDDPGKTGGVHQVQWLAARLGLPVPDLAAIRCWMWLRDDEVAWRPSGRYVTVSPLASWTQNKNWLLGQWQAVVDLLKAPVIQLGAGSDPKLRGARHQFMGAPLRRVAALIAGAAFHLCVVTGTMHIASAVGTRSIVVYGGREDPAVTGYAANVNLYRKLDCAPCWLIRPCPYATPHDTWQIEKPCMQAIRVRDVVQVIQQEYPWVTAC